MYPFVVALCERVYDGHNKVENHGKDEFLENRAEYVAGFLQMRSCSVQFRFLAVQERLERFLQLSPDHREHAQPSQGGRDEGLVERNYDEHFLDVHLYYRLSDEGGAEERPKRDQKMTASDSGQIEQRIRYLEKKKERETSLVTRKRTDAENVRWRKLKSPENPLSERQFL